jgi:CheY-like chemotaxis protein
MATTPRTPDPLHRASQFAPAKLPPGVLAKVGETFSIHLSALHQAFNGVLAQGPEQQLALAANLAEIERLQRLGVQIQAIARVLGGEGQATPERLDLSAALRQKLDEWAEPARRKGIHLLGPLEAFEIDVNAGVLEQLLDLAMESALDITGCVEVRVGVQTQTANPMLTVEILRAQGVAAPVSDAEFNDLHWMLFTVMARARGLVPQRVAVGDNVILMLEFPSHEVPTLDSTNRLATQSYRTPAVADRRVLVLEPSEFARVQAHKLLLDVGMKVDAVATLEQARGSLRDGVPDVLITGIPVRDARMGALLDELRAAHPRLRVIELVNDDSAFAFAFSSPGYANAARVGRQDLARTLVLAVAQELDAGGVG